MIRTDTRYKEIFNGDNIHPSYYQYLDPPKREVRQMPTRPARISYESPRGRNIVYTGVVVAVAVAVYSIFNITGPSTTSASIPSPEVIHAPIVERVRAQRRSYFRRVKEVERNIQTITKVLTFLHYNIIEAVGGPVLPVTLEHTRFSTADLPTVTVIVPKANLRAAPDINSEALAAVGEGTQLVLETATGIWFGVIAPTGEKAWVRTDLVSVDQKNV